MPGDGITHFKIFGERRSGTQLLQHLTAHNLPLIYQGTHWDTPMGWKHGYPNIDELKRHQTFDRTVFLVITKHPLSWLRSMYRVAPHMGHMRRLKFLDFLQAPWDERNLRDAKGSFAPNTRNYQNIFDLRYQKLSSHLGFLENVPERGIHLTYEALLRDVAATMNVLVRLCDLDPLPSGRDILDGWSRGNFPQKRRYYLRKEWLSEYTEEELAYASSQVDWEEEARLGYDNRC